MTSIFFLGCLVNKHRIGFIEDCFQHRAWGRLVTRPEDQSHDTEKTRRRSPPSKQLIHVLLENTSSKPRALPFRWLLSFLRYLYKCSITLFRLPHHIDPTLACPGPIDGEGEGRTLLSRRSERSFTVAAPATQAGGNTPC